MKRIEMQSEIKLSGCMECTSHAPNTKGYPRIRRDGKQWTISRYLYTKKHGEIPKGLVIRHTCDNKMCINIDHLLIGTQADNMQDKVHRNRQSRGSKGGTAKLTEVEVLEIRKLKGFITHKQIAKIYSVGSTIIGDIMIRKKWKHI